MINISKIIYDNKKSFFYIYNRINIYDEYIQRLIKLILYKNIVFMGLDPHLLFTEDDISFDIKPIILRIHGIEEFNYLFTLYFHDKNNIKENPKNDNELFIDIINIKNRMSLKIPDIEPFILKILKVRNHNGSFGNFFGLSDLLYSGFSLLIINEYLCYRMENINYV